MPYDDFDVEEGYQENLVQEVEQQKKKYNDDDGNEIFNIFIEKFNHRHTESGKNDGWVNWKKAEIEWGKTQHQFSKSEESLLRYQAQADGISLSQAKRNARKLLKGGK